MKKALKKGYAGLRLTGNTFWLEKKEWNTFTDLEEAMNEVIGKYKMIAVCTYSLDKCDSNEIIGVIRNHQFALVKRSGTWALIESSERKKIAEDLLRTEQKFAALYNSMTEGVALHDILYDRSGKAVDYIVTDVNPSYERIVGLTKKQVAGKKASELYGTGEPPYLDVFAKVASTGKPASFETYFPPMEKHFSISVFSPSKGKFNSVFHDITERKHAEQEIQSLAKFPLENPSAVMRVDGNGTIIYCNPASKSSLTHLRCEIGRQVPASMNKIAADALKSDTKIEFEETYGEKTFSFLFVPIAKEGYVNIYGVDTTERKAAELNVQKAKLDWERTFDSIPDLIAILDKQHRIVRANKAMAQRLGTTPDHSIGLNCYERVHGQSMPPEFCQPKQPLKDG